MQVNLKEWIARLLLPLLLVCLAILLAAANDKAALALHQQLKVQRWAEATMVQPESRLGNQLLASSLYAESSAQELRLLAEHIFWILAIFTLAHFFFARESLRFRVTALGVVVMVAFLATALNPVY